jgi:hypothetical protein
VSRRGLLAAAGAFVVLGLLALATLRRPQPAERAASRARPAARLGPHDFDTLEVHRTQDRDSWTTLHRTPSEVRVAAPVDYPADPPAGAAAFAAIEKLDFLDLVTDRPERYADSQVDAGKGIRVIARKGGQGGSAVLDLVVGKSVADYGTLVRLQSQADVWQVAGELREVFDKGPSDWRDRAVTTFRPSDVQSIEITAADGGRIVLRKTGTKTNFKHDDWEVVSSTVAIDRLDQLAPNQLVETMSSLKASTFADGAVTAASAGLDPPALRVSVALAGWPNVNLLIGERGGDSEAYVRNPEVPQLFLIKDFNLERIARRPLQFRDKTLCNISEPELAAFSVANGSDSYALIKRDGAWIAQRPAGLDTAKLAPLANVFRAFAAPSIAEQFAANTFSTTAVVINARSKTASCTIRVGAETADRQSYYVATPASKDVYVVPKWMIDRVAIRLDALAKNP